MFDPETAIANWRRQMLAAGIKTPVPLAELESRLRDDIEQQTKAGRGEAEAFAMAVQKIGQAPMVQSEFEKIADPKDALRWKFMEITFGVFASVMPLCLCGQVLHSGAGSVADLTRGQQISGVIAMVTFASLAWGGRVGYRMFPVIRAKRTRDIFTGFCAMPAALWWIIFMNIIVPRHEFTMGQFIAAFVWAFMVPGGAVIGLVWGMETAARKSFLVQNESNDV